MTLGKSFHPCALEMSRKGKKIEWGKNISPWQQEALEEAQSLMPAEGCRVWAHTSLRPCSQLFLQETPGAAGVSFLPFQGLGQGLQVEKDSPGLWQVWK